MINEMSITDPLNEMKLEAFAMEYSKDCQNGSSIWFLGDM